MKNAARFLLFWIYQFLPILFLVWIFGSSIRVVLWVAHFDWMAYWPNIPSFLIASVVEAISLLVAILISQRLKNTVLHGLFLVVLLIPATIGLVLIAFALEVGS